MDRLLRLALNEDVLHRRTGARAQRQGAGVCWKWGRAGEKQGLLWNKQR